MNSPRRLLRVSAMVGVVAIAFAGGVVTGVVGDDRKPALRSSVIEEAADRIAAKAARPVDRDALERAAVEGMLRAVGDRWSTYYERSEFASFRAALEGQYSGVGLWLRGAAPSAAARVEVGSVAPGSPAARAGVVVGELVLRVGGEDVTAADVPSVAAMLRGDDDSVVQVTLQRGASTRDVELRRVTLATPDVTVQRLRGSIARVMVTAFSRGVGGDLADALDASTQRPVRGVVLDLRDNPGGLLDEAVVVASAFLDGGPVVSYQRRGRASETFEAFPGGDVATPLVVLVNASTASAAEVVAAALQDRNRAIVVGSRTYGKGSVQEPTTLSDGSALELTVGDYVTPAGRSLEGVGVDPDVVVPPGQPPEVAERRAIEVLTGLVAALGGTGRG